MNRPRPFSRVSAVIAGIAVAMSASMAAAADPGYSREAYRDVTTSQTLPPPTGPLTAVAQYLAGMAHLDPSKIVIEAVADQRRRRVYRFELICKSAEACADDSVARTRQVVEVRRRRNGGWAIVWVGAQTICHQGRGHQDWSKEPCL